jgi:hypothetical protein
MRSKIIPHILYFGILIPGLIFDIAHFEIYYTMAVLAIQFVFITTAYIVGRRKFPEEALLLKETYPPSFIKLVLVMLLMLAIVVGFNFSLKIVSNKYLVIYALIIIVSFIIQYFIAQRKKTASLLIDGQYLISNELFLKTYNLETLLGISYDNFDEVYRIEFSSSSHIKIKQDDFEPTELYRFFAAMIAQKKGSVFLSENVKEAVKAVCLPQITNNLT